MTEVVCGVEYVKCAVCTSTLSTLTVAQVRVTVARLGRSIDRILVTSTLVMFGRYHDTASHHLRSTCSTRRVIRHPLTLPVN